MGTPRTPAPIAAQQQSVRGKLSSRPAAYSASSGATGPVSNPSNKIKLPSAPVASAPTPAAPTPIQDPAVEIAPEPAAPVETAPAAPKPLFKYASRKVGPQMTGAELQARSSKTR